ncbi:multiheme c-type cytochrome, partial [Vibrio campbellii]
MTQWASWKPALIGLAALVSFSLFAQETPQSNQSSTLTYLGSDACVDCHQKETQAWQGSHHDMAMRHADAQSVLGD